MRIVHVVVTGGFAGVERYAATAATELAGRGHELTIVGGAPGQTASVLGDGVRWLPGSTLPEAVRSLKASGSQDVCHAHMTVAEAAAIVAKPFHRSPIVATRHFAAHRGSTRASRALAPLISACLSFEIAASEYIASRLECRPDAVILNGVPSSALLWRPENRVVVVVQRLEDEKDTMTALRAWESSRLWDEGWSLRVVGRGSQRAELEAWARGRALERVRFVGWVPDVSLELAAAGLVLASAPAEPFGLVAVEAMAAGVPVIACAGGGHLETVGRIPEARTFPPGDWEAAGAALRSLVPDATRLRLSLSGRELVESTFTVEKHVDGLLAAYRSLPTRGGRRPRRRSPGRGTAELSQIVLCSLEPWDDVWRRNQFLVDGLLRRHTNLRVLFVEPPTDPLFDLYQGRAPKAVRLRTVGYQGRLCSFRPLKPLPRRLGTSSDRVVNLQVRAAARLLGFSRPVLWINDVTYAPLISATAWPSLYDVTDDWLKAPVSERERRRLEALDGAALRTADAVSVCSPALVESRGRVRPVALVPNAVDSAHFRRVRIRPDDLPPGPSALYVGSLHESRLDVALVIEIARSIPKLQVVLVGPDSLTHASHVRLSSETNIHLLGARPYSDVPAYLQHADVIVVPHLVNDFTDSLDPIKAYECLAVGTPTVATPVSGFRHLGTHVHVASRDGFVTAVESMLHEPRPAVTPFVGATWDDRAREFEGLLAGIRRGAKATAR